MKVKVLLALCFFGLVNAASARIVDITRKNGLFGYYAEIRQFYMGTINGQDWWTLDCQDPGFSKCRLRPTAGKTQRQSDIENAENNNLEALMTSIENTGSTSGSESHHYLVTISGVAVDIYIAISWAPDPHDSTKTLFHANVTNSEG